MSTALQATAQLRDALAELNDEAARDLTVVWRQVQTAAEAGVALHDILPQVIDAYGAAAAALAAQWYDDLRAKTGVAGRFVAYPADIPDSGAHALVAWAEQTATDMVSLQALIEGGMQRRVANFGRRTVMDSSVSDPQSHGWQRVSRGGCTGGFCDMLAGRGLVFSTKTADFAAHDGCQCYAVSVWGDVVPVRPYTPTLRHVSERDRARVRAWLRDNPQA